MFAPVALARAASALAATPALRDDVIVTAADPHGCMLHLAAERGTPPEMRRQLNRALVAFRQSLVSEAQ
jgi:hypothetical protein